MSNSSFSLFSNQNFVDCTLYQYGWEKCDPYHSFGPAVRNHFLFHYIISGKGVLVSQDRNGNDIQHRIGAGQGFLICPNQPNTYTADAKNPWQYAWVEFDGLKAAEILSLAGLSASAPVYTGSNPAMEQVVKDEMLYITGHPAESSFHLIGHLYLFFDALIKSSSRSMRAVGGKLKDFYAREAVSFIEHNYQNDITVEDMAAVCSLNRSYFGKIFKDVLSITPQEFLIRFRMAKACEYMETTNLTIGEISSRVGYPSQLHFSRAFKKTYGQSPREWRLTNQHK